MPPDNGQSGRHIEIHTDLIEESSALLQQTTRLRSTEKTQPPGVMSILCLVALKKRLWLLPVLTALWLFSSFWTSYAIAVSYNHTEANFPYISHTAIEAPERCVFGQMVNIGAVMLGMNVILRYLYVKKFLLLKDTKPDDRHYKVNLAGLISGIISAFGLSMVANFQTEVQRVPHYIGAFLAFGGGTVYCGIQTSLTFKIRYVCCNKLKMFVVQLVNTIVMGLMLVLFISTKLVYKLREHRGHGTKWDTLRGIYLTSTVTEWLLALSILTFTLTFAPDFKNMVLDDPNIHLTDNYVKKHSSEKLNASDTNSNFPSDKQMKTSYTTEDEINGGSRVEGENETPDEAAT